MPVSDPPTEPAESPQPDKDGHASAKAGALLYSGTLAGAIIVIVGFAVQFDLNTAVLNSQAVYRNVCATLYAGLLPAAVIGAIAGFNQYRLAVDARKPRNVLWMITTVIHFLIIVRALSIGLLPLWIGVIIAFLTIASVYYRPVDMLNIFRTYRVAPLFAMILYFSCCEQVTESQEPLGELKYLRPTVILVSLIFADCLLALVIATWKKSGRLAPPKPLKFQFSLGTMFAVVMVLAAYVSGLVVIFRR